MGIRISQLSPSQIPYTGREIIPMVQSSTTRSAPLSSLTNYFSGPLVSDAELGALSGNWQRTYTTVTGQSANWNNTYTSVANASANWNSTYTTVTNASPNWNSTYSTVSSFSAAWQSGGDTLNTVKNYLSTNNVQLSSATISDTLFVPVDVTELNADRVFSVNDNCKMFHFDTTVQALTATFPSSLPDGFNIALMNTGTKVLRLSATQLYAVGQGISVQYGAAFVYKDNGKIFAVGRL